MKVLIQDIKSGQYLAQHGTWVPTPDHAQDFRSTTYAGAVLDNERDCGKRVLFYFQEKGYCIKARLSHGDRVWRRMNEAALDF